MPIWPDPHQQHCKNIKIVDFFNRYKYCNVISRIWKILTPVLISIEEVVVINILPLMVQVKSEEQLQDPEMGSSGGLPSASSLMLETGSLYSSFSWTGVPDEADCWSQVPDVTFILPVLWIRIRRIHMFLCLPSYCGAVSGSSILT